METEQHFTYVNINFNPDKMLSNDQSTVPDIMSNIIYYRITTDIKDRQLFQMQIIWNLLFENENWQ